MRTIIADCETNGLLDTLDTVHSFCLTEFETGAKLSCADQVGYAPIREGLNELRGADLIVFHNGIGFDLKALRKVYGFQAKIKSIRDTLLLTRLMSPHIGDIDEGLVANGVLPSSLYGSHSLEAWGYRLSKHKGDYAAQMEEKGLDPWAQWNPHMQEYCEGDVEVTVELWKQLIESGMPERAVELEHWFAAIIAKQEDSGFPFDVAAAKALEARLRQERATLDAKIANEVQPWFVGRKEFTPKRDNNAAGYVAGASFTKVELVEFNPGSRDHIADRLINCYGWKPEKRTPKGKPKVDEDTLTGMENPVAQLVARRFTVDKRIAQLVDGSKGWMKLHRDGIMHGSVNTLGAVTGRCTHSNPNMAQVPACGAEFGTECRALFHAPPGYLMVGADASGLELRCLAHYMAEFDGGEYGRVLLEGDIHTTNQEAAGLPTRDNAKTFIYGFLYGAGDAKIGQIVGGTAEDGKQLKAKFLAGLPALKALRDKVLKQVRKHGYLEGIDGRKLYVRHEHAAINTLLQSAGALLVKQATINLFKRLTTEGYQWDIDWWIAAHVHDEYQSIVRESLAPYVAEVSEWSFRQAGIDFNWQCRLDGQAKIGRNWSETH